MNHTRQHTTGTLTADAACCDAGAALGRRHGAGAGELAAQIDATFAFVDELVRRITVLTPMQSPDADFMLVELRRTATARRALLEAAAR